MTRRFLAIIALLLLTQTMARGESQEGPGIKDFFTSGQITPGEPWNIYINAQIAEGETGTFIFKISPQGRAVYTLPKTEIKKPNFQQAGIFEEVHPGPVQQADSARIILVGVEESMKGIGF